MLDRRMRRQAERAFYNYPASRKACAEYIADQYTSGLTSQVGRVGRSSSVSDPTGNKAIKLTDGTVSLLWCRVVEMTLEHFAKSGKDELIRLRYFKQLNEYTICHERLYISRKSMFNWVEDILEYAIMLALQYQLIRMV